MSDHFPANATRPPRAQFIWTVAQLATILIASELGFYLLLPVIGLRHSYNTASIEIALYYVFWVGIAIITFWPLYATWPRYGRSGMFVNRIMSYAVWVLSFSGCIVFAAYTLPLWPSPAWTESWSPPELRNATALYFLPKSIDILFQQLLIVAFVLALSAQQYGIRKISVYCALGFGVAHVLLGFGEVPTGYVIRFMVAATAFGFVFPYLILRVPNGFAYTYIVHWLYYAVTVFMSRIVSSTDT